MDFIQLTFMIKSDNCTSRLGWSLEEQRLLKTLKEDAGINSWKIISNQLNSQFQGKCRSPKQCRERYTNYLREGVQQGAHRTWTEEQDHILFCKYFVHGSKWVQIAKQIPGRSQNSLKNRFYGSLRKIIRKIDKAKKFSKNVDKKPLRQDMLLKVLDSFVSQNIFESRLNGQYLQNCQTQNLQLMENIIKLGACNQNDIQSQKIIQIGSEIKKIYMLSRNKSAKANKEEKKNETQEQIQGCAKQEGEESAKLSGKKSQQSAISSPKYSQFTCESPINFNQKLYLFEDDEKDMIGNSIFREDDLLEEWFNISQQDYCPSMVSMQEII